VAAVWLFARSELSRRWADDRGARPARWAGDDGALSALAGAIRTDRRNVALDGRLRHLACYRTGDPLSTTCVPTWSPDGARNDGVTTVDDASRRAPNRRSAPDNSSPTRRCCGDRRVLSLVGDSFLKYPPSLQVQGSSVSSAESLTCGCVLDGTSPDRAGVHPKQRTQVRFLPLFAIPGVAGVARRPTRKTTALPLRPSVDSEPPPEERRPR
jgi:hypothetical protein